MARPMRTHLGAASAAFLFAFMASKSRVIGFLGRGMNVAGAEGPCRVGAPEPDELDAGALALDAPGWLGPLALDALGRLAPLALDARTAGRPTTILTPAP